MAFTYNSTNLSINELHRRINAAIFEGKRVIISVTYNVAEYEEDGIYTPATTTEHVGQIVSTTLQDSTTHKRFLIVLAGIANPFEISSETQTYLSIEK